ncbi:S-adenosylmethionine decarboxylase [Pigmentibacter sp. JX0631]|uniref:S-adenosylmethionine decarboxylase n=1 Tax=Pigmentibacter sp. JX0631 TaxID=2976982 RepID=UPI0024684AD8|nr:S-adenosylmethionine decarboxylase [Pigmentibacter sp. JX0631]WGL60214.1 S-adenosylmethionine decarboxylase [Pigmentibacter sp. JX0631]
MTEILGFNNLTKALSFNLYDFAVALNDEERASYIRYIDERYSAKQIESQLIRIAEIIDAEVLNVSSKDFDPYGASVVLLMSDLKGDQATKEANKASNLMAQSTVSIHLDKSHICAHTYPDSLDPSGICSFRVDIDIATCGSISPLYALDFMFKAFETDVVCVDYVVRGFARTKNNEKIFMDHEMSSITKYVSPLILRDYDTIDQNSPEHHTFQTMFCRRELDESSYFRNPRTVPADIASEKMALIRKEMESIAKIKR